MSWGKGKTIAVIDDSIDFNSIVAKLFKKTNFEGKLHIYPFPESFFHKGIEPDLLICDLCLPKILGSEVYFKIKKEMPNTKFILVSANAEMVQADHLHEQEYPFFLKPISKDSFLEGVKKCLI